MVSVATQHYNNSRTGWNSNETTLTVSNVGNLKHLFDMMVDGQVYAQPLHMDAITFPGQGVHNAIYIATENDTVFAFDADTQQPFLWKRSLLAAGELPLDDGDIEGCNNIAPKIGITSTPVIDSGTNTLYVASKTKRSAAGKTTFHHFLHALDITTGKDRPNSPVEIAATAPGWGGTGEIGGQDNRGNVIFVS